MELENLLAHLDGMASVVTALEPDYEIHLICVIIYDLTLTFVTPLGADNYGAVHVNSDSQYDKLLNNASIGIMGYN